MFSLNSLLLFSENPKELTKFYKKVLKTNPVWEEANYSGFLLGEGMLIIGPHDKVHGKNEHPERLIFNLTTKNVKKEFERIEKLQATIVKKPYHPGEAKEMLLATFADPDGNYFQLATPME